MKKMIHQPNPNSTRIKIYKLILTLNRTKPLPKLTWSSFQHPRARSLMRVQIHQAHGPKNSLDKHCYISEAHVRRKTFSSECNPLLSDPVGFNPNFRHQNWGHHECRVHSNLLLVSCDQSKRVGEKFVSWMTKELLFSVI